MPYKNPEDKKARMQKYRAENKDRIRETAREWRLLKRTEINQYKRKAYLVRQYKSKPRLKHLYECVLSQPGVSLWLDNVRVDEMSTDWTMEKGAKPQLHLRQGDDWLIAYLATQIEISDTGVVSFDLWDDFRVYCTLWANQTQLDKTDMEQLIKGGSK